MHLLSFKEGRIERKTATLHFFTCQRVWDRAPNPNVSYLFKCKICANNSLQSSFYAVSNLGKHLEKHQEVAEWLELHKKKQNRFKEVVIDENLWRFLTYFLSSNLALTELRNKHFLGIVLSSIKCPSYEQLRYRLLKVVLAKLMEVIQNRFNSAIYVTLITDIWSNRLNTRFLGLAACCTYIDSRKEMLVMDLQEIEERASAEVLREKIEEIVNKFAFDKSKIKGIHSLLIIHLNLTISFG